MLKDFKAFVLRGNMVDLAVGIVIGAAFGRVIDTLVKGLITPLVSLPGDVNLAVFTFTLGGQRFAYGAFLDELISFVILAAVIFFFVVKPVNHLVERLKPEHPVDDPTRACPECLSTIPARAPRCAFCSSPVGAG